jgi:hypothetical protein
MRAIRTFRFTSLVLTLVATGEERNNSTRSHHRENDGGTVDMVSGAVHRMVSAVSAFARRHGAFLFCAR